MLCCNMFQEGKKGKRKKTYPAEGHAGHTLRLLSSSAIVVRTKLAYLMLESCVFLNFEDSYFSRESERESE